MHCTDVQSDAPCVVLHVWVVLHVSRLTLVCYMSSVFPAGTRRALMDLSRTDSSCFISRSFDKAMRVVTEMWVATCAITIVLPFAWKVIIPRECIHWTQLTTVLCRSRVFGASSSTLLWQICICLVCVCVCFCFVVCPCLSVMSYYHRTCPNVFRATQYPKMIRYVQAYPKKAFHAQCCNFDFVLLFVKTLQKQNRRTNHTHLCEEHMHLADRLDAA